MTVATLLQNSMMSPSQDFRFNGRHFVNPCPLVDEAVHLEQFQSLAGKPKLRSFCQGRRKSFEEGSSETTPRTPTLTRTQTQPVSLCQQNMLVEMLTRHARQELFRSVFTLWVKDAFEKRRRRQANFMDALCKQQQSLLREVQFFRDRYLKEAERLDPLRRCLQAWFAAVPRGEWVCQFSDQGSVSKQPKSLATSASASFNSGGSQDLAQCQAHAPRSRGRSSFSARSRSQAAVGGQLEQQPTPQFMKCSRSADVLPPAEGVDATSQQAQAGQHTPASDSEQPKGPIKRGPERFFYDTSTYTGVARVISKTEHRQSGISSVPLPPKRQASSSRVSSSHTSACTRSSNANQRRWQ